MATTQLSCSRAVPVGFEDACERVLHLPLPELFRRRFLAIAPIRETRQEGSWGTPGQTRVIRLADGGSMQETLTRVDPPHSFGYSISGIRGPLQPLVPSAEGEWSFEPAGTGTRITWSWLVTPTPLGGVAMPVFRAMWNGYARPALEEIERLLLG